MSKKKINSEIIGLRELRDNTEEYIREVGNGKSFLVMRRSEPVFKLTPIDTWGDDGSWKTTIDFNDIKKGGIDITEILKQLHS
jgi:prevent-host-death family protein